MLDRGLLFLAEIYAPGLGWLGLINRRPLSPSYTAIADGGILKAVEALISSLLIVAKLSTRSRCYHLKHGIV
jgi:hypothetical protein